MKKLAVLVPLSVVLLGSARSGAQEELFSRRPIAAPSNAFEPGVAVGYTQPVGLIERGRNIHDVAGPQVAVEASAGWRIVPELSIAVSGQYFSGQANAADISIIRGFTSGVDATYHFDPHAHFDPFLQAGVGYRMMWAVGTNNGTDVLDHGFRLFRLIAGLDMKRTPSIAIAPIVGADVNMFLWQRENGRTTNISDPRANVFLFGGLMGKFDVGGMEEPPPVEVARK